ncbi:MAG: ABC transporter ATP-binding protein, partial [Terriglobia bacterium]
MTQVKRLIRFIRPYTFRFFAALALMAVVGGCEGLTALLIKPVFDRVLTTERSSGPILLFKLPFGHHALYLQDLVPRSIHSAWAMVAVAIVGVTLAKGISEYFATYSVNFIGQSVVRDLR